MTNAEPSWIVPRAPPMIPTVLDAPAPPAAPAPIWEGGCTGAAAGGRRSHQRADQEPEQESPEPERLQREPSTVAREPGEDQEHHKEDVEEVHDGVSSHARRQGPGALGARLERPPSRWPTPPPRTPAPP